MCVDLTFSLRQWQPDVKFSFKNWLTSRANGYHLGSSSFQSMAKPDCVQQKGNTQSNAGKRKRGERECV